MAEFRFTLGQSRGSNLVQNGDFSSGVGWTTDAGWTIGAGTASHAGARDNLTQSGIFELGKRYEVDFDIVNHVTGGANVRVGLYGKEAETANGSYTVNRRCIGNTDLVFNGVSTFDIDNVAAYEMEWNTPLTNQPKNWDEAKIVIERDKDINGFISKYFTDLIWWGDGWDFILAQYEADGYCAKIPVRIEYRCSPNDDFATFEQFPEGVLYLTDAEFDTERCEVKATIEDRNASQVLMKAKDVKIFAGADDFDHSRGLIPANSREFVDFHDSTGAYPGGTYDNIECYIIEDLFRLVILAATELEAEFESSYFTSAPFDNLAITLGAMIRDNTKRAASSTDAQEELSFSFKELFEEMNKIHSLEVLPKLDANGVPTIQVEDKQSFLAAASGITLSGVKSPKFRFNLEEIFKTVSVGYEKDSSSTKRKDQKKEKGIQYVSDDQCSQGDLNLVSKFIQDGEIIEDILDGTIADDQYDHEVFLVQMDQASASPNLQTEIAPGNLFNEDLDPADNMDRWVENLQNNVFQERAANSPNTATKTSDALVRIWEFDHPISFSDFQLFDTFTESIDFTGAGITGTITGYLVRLEWSVKTTKARWTLKTQ